MQNPNKELNEMLYKVLFTKATIEDEIPNHEYLKSLGYRFVVGWSDQGYWGIIPSNYDRKKDVPLSVSKDGDGHSGIWWASGHRMPKNGENIRAVVKKMDLVGILSNYRKERLSKYRHMWPICPRIVTFKDAKRTIWGSTAYLERLDKDIAEATKSLQVKINYRENESKRLTQAQNTIDKIMKEVRK